MLSSIFKKGVQWGLINENPCSRAEHPKAEEIDVRVLTEEEIPKLLDALSDAPPQYSVITQLALLLGARRGEICALRWSDIDFEKGTLSIKRTVQSIPGIGLVFNAPKTRRGKRCLRIGADCVELLQEYRRYQKVKRFRIGSAWVRKVTLENGKVVDNDMLFTKWNGEPMDPDIISTWFPKFLEVHDLPSIHFHSLRHSNASILIAAHVPITTVSGRLGLSDRLARELIKEPDFPAVMIHGRYRIFRSKAQQWLEEHYPVNARSEAIAEVMVGGNEND